MPPLRLSIIVAFDALRGIGIDNALPWHLPEDLAHFKRITTGHPIIMGRKTFESIGRALPNRRNIVITRNAQWRHEGVESAASIAAAVALAASGSDEAFIIGGAQIYADALPLADRLLTTEIAEHFACDAFFPALDMQSWQLAAREEHQTADGRLHYAFATYVRH